MPQDNISSLTVTPVLSVCALEASGFHITFAVFAGPGLASKLFVRENVNLEHGM